MHHCLTIQEIVANIIFEIPETFGPLDRTLAGLARTCRAFSEPALDALWCSQPNLFNLLKYLPADSYEANGSHLVPKRAPSLEHRWADEETEDLSPERWDNMAAVLIPFAAQISKFVVFDARGSFMELHCRFSNLQTQDTHHVKMLCQALAHIATLPLLESLHIALSVKDSTQFNVTVVPHKDQFRNLAVAEIHVTDLAVVNGLLVRPGFRHLESLAIMQFGIHHGSNWDLEELFKVLNARQESRTLLKKSRFIPVR
ncbi:hypothetical protein DXG03_000723 [Asterophora parasitica]|uniref:F-box domain-containing protein n=1 Tax=Asterophora parasitica TaxID=117018 RepID=A0A9P7KD61_9AGAR|nr:hypothetical protein DXG03_000723 [Asterophora parasitica]